MNATTTTPAIENVKVRPQSVTLYADMNLASIPFTVTGQYNINSNCFYPSLVMPTIDIMDGDIAILKTGQSHDLEDACKALGWDFFDTQELIQEAVEKRDA